jgi:anti-sigma B factor antagonist
VSDSVPRPEPEIVALAAEIDISNALQACAQLFDVIDAGAPVVIADMSNTGFCDSAGFRMLLVANDRAADCGCDLRFVVAGGTAVLRSLALLALDRVLSVYPSLDEALTTGGRPKQA